MELALIASRIAAVPSSFIIRVASRLTMSPGFKRVVGRVTVPARIVIDVSDDAAFDGLMSSYSPFTPIR